MRKLIVMFAFVAVFAPMTVLAQMHGVLSGRVVDTEGRGVIGASVFIEGTTRGTTVRAQNGSFTVTNIVAGNYTVRVRAVGKQEHKVNVRISVDQTTNINVTLRDDAVMMEAVEVVAERAGAAAVDVTSVGSINTLTSDDLTRSTSTSITSVVGMSAGVSSGDGGYAIRGSRTSETQIRLDGLNMGDQFSGGFGGAGARYFPMVSAYATEEVQVITGNFSAQYGDAQGGIINSVMKTGRTDRFEGHIFFEANGLLTGSQKNSSQVLRDAGKFKVVDSDSKGAKLLSNERKFIDVGFGGPLAFINNRSTFYVSVGHIFEPHNDAYDIKNPWGESLGRPPVSGEWVKNIEGRLRFGLTNDIQLILGGKFGLTSGQNTSFRYYLEEGMPSRDANGNITPFGTPTPNGIPGYEGKAQAYNQYVNNALARINHTLTNRSFYEFTIAIAENNFESGRKVAGSNLNYFKGFEIMQPEDKWFLDGAVWSPATYHNGVYTGDKAIDWASAVNYAGFSKDGYCHASWVGINPFTGYYEGNLYSNGTNNPWGTSGMAFSGGTQGFSFRHGNFKQMDGNYNLYGLETGDFKHTIKAGFEATYYTMHRHLNNNPSSGSPVYDIFTDKWGGNIYAESDIVFNKTTKPINQFKFGMYVQDQIAYKGLIVTPGLRLDVMDPMNQYRVIDPVLPQFIPISSNKTGVGGFEDASVKFRVSPRININYPITESSYISLSYGQFFQSAPVNYLYDNFNMETIRAGSYVGNPNMEAQQTNQYEVSYNNQLTTDFMFSATAYFKDIYNQLGLTQMMVAPDSYLMYDVSEYGSSRGVEFMVRKRPSNHFAFNLSYTLAYLTVTSSEVTSNASPLVDPYTNKVAFPLAPYFSSSDVRHLVKGNVYFYMNRGDGPTIGGMQPLQNSSLAIEPTWRSGRPYTMRDIGGMDLSERNSYRHPSYWIVNLKASKSFMLRDWFGESMRNSMIEFQLTVNNVFNRRAPVVVFPTTHDPLDNGAGLNTTLLGNFSELPLYKEATHANPASYIPDQYDIYGNRLYNAAADFDGNGVVTQQEKYDAWRKWYEGDSIQRRSNFQMPIVVNAGVLLRF